MRIIREDHQNCLFGSREMSYDKPSACEKRCSTFTWKRVMVKAGIPPFISKETVCRFLNDDDWLDGERAAIPMCERDS